MGILICCKLNRFDVWNHTNMTLWIDFATVGFALLWTDAPGYSRLPNYKHIRFFVLMPSLCLLGKYNAISTAFAWQKKENENKTSNLLLLRQSDYKHGKEEQLNVHKVKKEMIIQKKVVPPSLPPGYQKRQHHRSYTGPPWWSVRREKKHIINLSYLFYQ